MVFAIIAPILPSADQAAVYGVRTVVPGLHAPAEATRFPKGERLETRVHRVKRTQPVASSRSTRGSTPFELYALSPGEASRPVVEPDTRLCVPRCAALAATHDKERYVKLALTA